MSKSNAGNVQIYVRYRKAFNFHSFFFFLIQLYKIRGGYDKFLDFFEQAFKNAIYP